MPRIFIVFFLVSFLNQNYYAWSEELKDKELWHILPEYEILKPEVIAVLPIDNLSLENDINQLLYNEVYNRLQSKGYKRISIEIVEQAMKELGIQIAGQLDGISLKKIKTKLKCDAIIRGRIDQSADIHKGIMDAVVVSCSLRLMHCETGKTLWQTEQWRTAHRQFQIDPINALINLAVHSNASREERIGWLVQEMFRTLPDGEIHVQYGDLLNQAIEVNIEE